MPDVHAPPTTTLPAVHRRWIVDACPPGGRVLVWGDDAAHGLEDWLPPTASVVVASAAASIGGARLAGAFDLIVVDDGDRPAALAHATLHLAPGGTVCLHDAQRPAYDEAKRAFRCTAVIGAASVADPAWLWMARRALEPATSEMPVPLIVSFYTVGTKYEDEAARLRADCARLGLDARIEGVDPRGSWARNTNLKARFCRALLEETGRPMLWVDADARLHARPAHPSFMHADIALHRWDDWQLATGTMFFNTTDGARAFLDAWVEWSDRLPDVPDQIAADLAWEAVSVVSPLATAWLPRTLCQIVGTPRIDGAPVVEHLMASRRLKAHVSGGVATPYPQPPAALQLARRAARPRLWRVPTADADAMLGALITEAEAELCDGPANDHDRRWLDDVAGELTAERERARARAAAHLAAACAQRFLTAHAGPFAIYGAGAVGRMLLDGCRAAGRLPVAFVETAPPQDACVEGLEVWSPETARARGVCGFLLGTHASASVMRAGLLDVYGPSAALVVVAPDAPVDDTRTALPAPLEEARRVVAAGRSLSEYTWLRHHRDERMDAAVAVNPAARRLLHLDRYRFAARYAPGHDVLDCASGTGYGSGWLARHAYASRVVGVECDAEAVAYATRHYGASHVTFLEDDACSLGAIADASVDLVVSFETIEHVADDQAMLRAFTRVLRPTGRCVVSTPNDWPIETSPYHVRTYDQRAFADLLGAWFEDVTLYAQHVPSDGVRGGIVPLTETTAAGAECIVAVCASPRPTAAGAGREP